MSADEDYIYRVIDSFGRDASGYNNTAGTFAGIVAAKRGKSRAEKLDACWTGRGVPTKAPFRIQRTKIDWVDVDD